MKRISLIWTILIALMFPALVVGQGGTKPKVMQVVSVEQQLKQMEDNWVKAIMNRDTATLSSIIAKGYFVTDDSGKIVNKEQYVSRMTSYPAVVSSIENFDMQVRVYGNAAVVTGGDKENGTLNKTAFTNTYRWTDVFVKRGGRWQAVVEQYVKVP